MLIIKAKLVSVIIPVYNVEKYLYRCVKSVQNQTYENIEVILVDDGSPDNSPVLCDEYAKFDNRFRVVHKKNGGLSDARNAGMDIAQGDYILFLDSDDYIELEMIKDAVEAMENSNSDVVIWGYYADYVDNNEKVITSNKNSCIASILGKDEMHRISVTRELIGLLGYAWNKLYRSELLKDNGFKFTKGLSLVEDIVFNGPVLSKAEKICFIETPYVHYMQRPRETLGAKFYENYYEMKKLAVQSIESLLSAWGKAELEISVLTAEIEFNSLKTTIRLVSQADNYSITEKKEYLKKLLERDDVRELLRTTKVDNLKDKFIKSCMILKYHTILLNIYSAKK